MIADVFDAEGRYLGPVRMPEGAVLYPSPLVSSTNVWMSGFHEMGHPQVVRFSIVPGG